MTAWFLKLCLHSYAAIDYSWWGHLSNPPTPHPPSWCSCCSITLSLTVFSLSFFSAFCRRGLRMPRISRVAVRLPVCCRLPLPPHHRCQLLPPPSAPGSPPSLPPHLDCHLAAANSIIMDIGCFDHAGL
ncbi:hypothetical protein SKAU_G00141170 [Synaphobranchus kaupii]|uniref:Uncharacterized protein n=1 Tax=Synaphobranchus kaupii TaxID=118154 RepID=A0A9Q1J403_SYNKA|nr:hypothetical protein SKAU_G00141170 [Synaphobranchus kaupii]